MRLKAIGQDRRKDRHRNRVQRKPFCGVDGEGGNIDGRHEYLLLRAGTEHVLETGKPLSWHECLGFLADLPKDRIYVSFYFDYDVTMMLRDLPAERLNRLLDRDCRRIPDKPGSSFPVDVGDYQIDYLGRKEFKVRRRKKGAQWTVVQDVGSFFQCSFVVALKRWFGDGTMDAQIDKIAEGKAQRHDFGQVTEDERQYNLLEIIMLENMMEKFRSVCDELELKPHRWEGPGNLVAAVFQREKLPKNKDIGLFEEYPLVAIMANMGYYGGRFEVVEFGFIQ